MAYGLSNGHMTNDVTYVTLKSQTRDPNRLGAKYLENGTVPI